MTDKFICSSCNNEIEGMAFFDVEGSNTTIHCLFCHKKWSDNKLKVNKIKPLKNYDFLYSFNSNTFIYF